MGTLRRSDGEVVFEQEGVGQVRRVQFTATADQRKTDEAIRRNTAANP